jgi:hypothetical protein
VCGFVEAKDLAEIQATAVYVSSYYYIYVLILVYSQVCRFVEADDWAEIQARFGSRWDTHGAPHAVPYN